MIALLLGAVMISLVWASEPVHAGETAGDESPEDLTELSIEELMNIEVISVSKKPEKRFEAAAALYVITAADIRSAGVTTIPDALRLAPGVHVARIDSNKYVVSVRGFSSRFTNKLLVLMDGRSVYTPLFGGVYWDVQDTVIEDIERIEVIRGPGGTIWGANAVNGVINIITKNAHETPGFAATAGGGDEEEAFASLRYGGRVGESAAYRAYVKYFRRDTGALMPLTACNRDPVPPQCVGIEATDEWWQLRAGFRSDWDIDADSRLTLQGDWYDGESGLLALRPDLAEHDADVGGANLLGRWKTEIRSGLDATLQVYYDRTERREPKFTEVRDTFDIDFQQRADLPWRQELSWGLGYRLTSDDLSGELAQVIGDNRNDQLGSAFLQDEVWLLPETLRLTVGTKVEHNDYSGFEVQPSGRLLWNPLERHALWGAISRAVRTPSRVGDEFVVNLVPDPRSVSGRADDAEELLAYEIGYRVRPSDASFVSLSGFYNQYDDLTSLEPGDPIPLPDDQTVVPFSIENKRDGDVYGGELTFDWYPLERWSLHGTYSFVRMALSKDADSNDPISESVERATPRHQAALRSNLDLPAHFEFDAVLRYADNLPVRIGGEPVNPTGSYFTLDLRLAYRIAEQVELSVVGRNLLEDVHAEFRETVPTIAGTDVERSVHGKLTWHF